MLDAGAELIVFAGGDGTARDIADAVGVEIPVIAVPSGVKVYSSVFAYSPVAAAELLDAFLDGADVAEEEVLVLAAASTVDVVEELAQEFTEREGIGVVVSTGATNALAAQILAGAPADLFLAAHEEWEHTLAERGLGGVGLPRREAPLDGERQRLELAQRGEAHADGGVVREGKPSTGLVAEEVDEVGRSRPDQARHLDVLVRARRR